MVVLEIMSLLVWSFLAHAGQVVFQSADNSLGSSYGILSEGLFCGFLGLFPQRNFPFQVHVIVSQRLKHP